MQKRWLGGLLAAGLCSMTAQADTILGLYAGAQYWQMDAEGGFANTQTLTEFQFDDESQNVVYAALEHPIPLIPNLKLRRTSMDTAGLATLQSDFVFNGETFTANSQANTDVSLTATDFILYYEIFDNDLLTADIGVNGKHLDGDIMVSNADQMVTQSFSQVVPMAYGRVASELPFTGWGIDVEGSFLSIDDSSLYDLQAMLTYQWTDNPAVDARAQFGYRSVMLELDDVDDLYTDFDFTGPYVGVEVHF